jgi:parvulin-like peptidyl-prolyl isomerase
MSIRTRPVKRSRRARLSRLFEGEERQQLVVTIVFILAIIAVLLILLGTVALAWYNDNLRPLANVGGVEIGPQQLRDYEALETWQINRDLNRLTQAQVDGTIDPTTAGTLSQDLNTQGSNLTSDALTPLVDLVYQSQLAPAQGISVTDQDIDQRLATETAAPEQRHVLAIVIAPQAADATTGPTTAEQKAARDQAQAALDAINSGQSFADVAAQYSTDPSAQNGGDYGVVEKGMVLDTDWGDALFALPQGGTTGIILGTDGSYRIGRVTEITPGAEVPGAREDLFAHVSEAAARQLLGYQIGAERLHDKIVADALAQTPEQAHLATIYIDGLDTGDPSEADGEIHYSEIVFAPNHDETTAANLAADDPAWATALQDANNALADIQAETDPATRETTFGRLASELSDDATKSQNGDVGWMTKDLVPATLADALWGSDHAKDDVLGPIRSDEGYYLLLFQEKRASIADRLKAVQDALAQPGANFSDVADQLSEQQNKEPGGDLGWWIKDDLLSQTQDSTFTDTVFGLDVGQVSDPLELGNGHFFIKMEEKGPRALDADQASAARATAFDNWYSSQLNNAKANGTVSIAGEAVTPTLAPGSDQQAP